MHQFLVASRSAAARTLRWPGVALALVLGTLAPRLASAQATEAGRICHELVDALVERCDDLGFWLLEFGCYYVGAIGTVICILIDTATLLGGSVGLP